MALKSTIGNIVGVNVKGVYNDEHGVAKDIDFLLNCKRLTGDEADEALNNDFSAPSIMRFMLSVATDWSKVKDDAGNVVPFSQDEFEERCNKISGLLYVTYKCYREQSGVRAKN